MEGQQALVSEVSRLVAAVNDLVNTLSESKGVGAIDMTPEAIEENADGGGTTLEAAQEIQLGYEIDQCSGSLTVRNRHGQYVSVPRGASKRIEVAIDGNGYWYWRCGSSGERSRGAPNFRQRVKVLRVLHSRENRKITWWCYDVL